MNGKPWTDAEIRRFCHFYPDLPTADLARIMGRSRQSLYAAAGVHGIGKSERFFAMPASGRTTGRQGCNTRFRKGHVPFNKGRKGWQAGGRSRETQFRKGHQPQTWVPIGTEVYSKDGYLKRKVTDYRNPCRKDWKFVHIMIWEEHNGPVPKGYAVVFKNGNKADIRIENLELLSRAELMRRNTIHRYPPELRQVIRLNGKLRRTIKKVSSNEKQD